MALSHCSHTVCPWLLGQSPPYHLYPDVISRIHRPYKTASMPKISETREATTLNTTMNLDIGQDITILSDNDDQFKQWAARVRAGDYYMQLFAGFGWEYSRWWLCKIAAVVIPVAVAPFPVTAVALTPFSLTRFPVRTRREAFPQ